jgi:hypothetical protein
VLAGNETAEGSRDRRREERLWLQFITQYLSIPVWVEAVKREEKSDSGRGQLSFAVLQGGSEWQKRPRAPHDTQPARETSHCS